MTEIISFPGILTYFIVATSLKVTELSFKVMSSTVTANGIPNSSVLAYLLPILSPDSSIFDDIPALTNDFFNFWDSFVYASSDKSGKIETLYGAILDGN